MAESILTSSFKSFRLLTNLSLRENLVLQIHGYNNLKEIGKVIVLTLEVVSSWWQVFLTRKLDEQDINFLDFSLIFCQSYSNIFLAN